MAKRKANPAAICLRDHRAMVRVVLDGSWPCLAPRGYVAGLGPIERERFRTSGDALREPRNAGLVVPVYLPNRPSGLTAQVIVGPLSTQQEAEWVGRLTGRLKIPCGCLAIGEIEALFGPPGQPPLTHMIAHVAVPPGDYRVEMFAFLPSADAFDLFAHRLGYRFAPPGRGRGEPLGTYFRRTRPGTPMPDWVRAHLCEEPDDDPGHEEEWEEAHYEQPRDYLGHVIRLSPAADADAGKIAPASAPGSPGGWLAYERRKPDACPLGIPLEAAGGSE